VLFMAISSFRSVAGEIEVFDDDMNEGEKCAVCLATAGYISKRLELPNKYSVNKVSKFRDAKFCSYKTPFAELVAESGLSFDQVQEVCQEIWDVHGDSVVQFLIGSRSNSMNMDTDRLMAAICTKGTRLCASLYAAHAKEL